MIHVINATCRRCGRVVRVQGENATGDLYIDMLPELTITAMCKNIMVCNEKAHRNQKSKEQEPAVLYQDGVPAYLWLSS